MGRTYIADQRIRGGDQGTAACPEQEQENHNTTKARGARKHKEHSGDHDEAENDADFFALVI